MGGLDQMPARESLKEKIYRELFEAILLNKMPPDEIITEKQLIEQFGVSKSPVREALIELCNEGILRSIPRYGYEVIRLTDRDVYEIQEYRAVLECGMLDKHWDSITPEYIETLLQMWTENKEKGSQQDALEHWNRNTKFHLKVFSFFNNKYLYNNLEQALRVLTRAYAQFFWDRWHRTVFTSNADHHKMIIDCMREGNKALALQYLREDVANFQEEAKGAVAK